MYERELLPPETNEKSEEYLRLHSIWNEYNYMKWDCWTISNIPKMRIVRRLMSIIEFKMKTA